MMMVVLMITVKNMLTVMKKVTVKRLTTVMLGLMKMKKY